MLIDWFTVIAQVINFLILVYLLKRFLYKPVLKAIDDREKRIKGRLEEAEIQKKEAEEQHVKYDALTQELKSKEEALMEKATLEADAKKEELIRQAKDEYRNLRTSLKKSLDEERKSLDSEGRVEAQRQLFGIVRKVLTDLSDSTLEDQIVRVFVDKLKNLEEDKLKDIRGLASTGEPVVIRTSFEIDEALKNDITSAVNKVAQQKQLPQFKVDPDSIGGIELTIGGYGISWTISEYLNSLESRLMTSSDEATGP
jgi:F-type H+-transporting ATPase subunit b